MLPSSESPFEAVQRLLSEPSSFVDELKIIAGEKGKLSSADRDVLRRAADEFDDAYRTINALYAALIEARQHLSAAQERLADRQKQMTLSPPFMSLVARIGPAPLNYVKFAP